MRAERLYRYRLVLIAAGAFLVLSGVAPTPSRAQDIAGRILGQRAVGVGIFWGVGNLSLDAPPENASAEVKGYSEALPSEVEGAGPAVGLSFGTFGVIFGRDDNTIDVDATADVKQTPGVTTDDVFVKSARRVNTSITLSWQPHPVLLMGIGKDQGTVTFDQINPDGTRGHRAIGYDSTFYSLALFAGFDPTTHQIAPIITVFAKIPTARGIFGGTTLGGGLGIYF